MCVDVCGCVCVNLRRVDSVAALAAPERVAALRERPVFTYIIYSQVPGLVNHFVPAKKNTKPGRSLKAVVY